MQFQNPWGALALLLAAPLLLLYLLKQRHREVRVPSIALWQQVLTQWEAAHPWQKWRRNLLFFLQLLAVCLLALALMRPVWRTVGTGRGNIVILDVSMSMQAVEDGRSRLDRAREGVGNLVGQMGRDEGASLIVCGIQNEPLITRSLDKQAFLRLLDQAEAQYGGGSIEDAVQLAGSLRGEEGGEMIHIFTDRPVNIQEEHVVVHNVALGRDNVAVTSASYSRDSRDGGLVVLGLLRNFGGAVTVSVELWGDGALLDVRECALDANSPGNVLFDGLDGELESVTLSISEEDALMADNRAYLVVGDAEKYRVLLQTERNVFLEKAILLRDDIELYKTTPSEELPQGRFSLLIGDGWAGSELPEGQHLWMIAPQEGNGWFAPETAEAGEVRIGDTGQRSPLFRYVDLSNLRVAKSQALETQDASTAILAYMGDRPLIILREEEGFKQLAFGFDLHESNLPLQKDFPILVQNILAWFLPLKEGQADQALVGSPVTLSLQGDAVAYDVALPDGSTLRGQTRRQFEETRLPGIYSVTQFDASGAELGRSGFAVNASAPEESELRTAGGSGGNPSAEAAERWSNRNLWPYVILLALVLMSLEWWVYHRGT